MNVHSQYKNNGGQLKFYTAVIPSESKGNAMEKYKTEKLVERTLQAMFGYDIRKDVEDDKDQEDMDRRIITEPTKYIDFPITNQQEYFIYAYIINQTLKVSKNTFIGYGKKRSIPTGYSETTEVPINGIFLINDPNNNIIAFELNMEHYSISVKSETVDVNDIYNAIISEFENNNFYKFKNMELTGDGIKFHKPNKADFESVILDKKLKDDIYSNSVFFLENFDGSNGIILHGPPGSGKSLVCTAIVNESLKKGFTTIYITERIDLNYLRDFIERVAGDCVIIFEDIDSIAQSRKDMINTGIASLLQLISGISDIKRKILFIATTNYIDHLDDAIKNRPMRFNRKYLVDYPKETEVDQLLKLYFGDTKVDNKICYNKKFTGAHIKELKRSFDLEKKRYPDKTDEDIFKQIVSIVKDNFEVAAPSSIGFDKPAEKERKSGFL